MSKEPKSFFVPRSIPFFFKFLSLFALRLQSVLSAYLAILLEREFLLHFFLVALRIARDLLAFATAQLHQHFFDDAHNKSLKIQYFLQPRAVDRNRTGDLLLTMEMLYQLSYNGLISQQMAVNS